MESEDLKKDELPENFCNYLKDFFEVRINCRKSVRLHL